MAEVVYKGAVAPESMTLTVNASGSEDLSTVTSAVIWVKCQGGTPVAWTATIATQSQKSILLSHTFSAGEVDTVGRMKLVAYLTTPGGIIRSKATDLSVVDPFQ